MGNKHKQQMQGLYQAISGVDWATKEAESYSRALIYCRCGNIMTVDADTKDDAQKIYHCTCGMSFVTPYQENQNGNS